MLIPIEHPGEPDLPPCHERNVRAYLADPLDFLTVLDPTQAVSPDILQVFGQDTKKTRVRLINYLLKTIFVV